MADQNDQTYDSTIWDDGKTKAVSVVTDGAVNRLSVDSREQPATNYQLKTSIGSAGTSVGTSDVTLYSFTGAGVLDFVSVNDAISSSYEVAIYIDSVERIRISMDTLGNTLGLTDSNYEICTQTANKQFRFSPVQIGFTTNFSIVARATTGTRALYHLVLFREQVV